MKSELLSELSPEQPKAYHSINLNIDWSPNSQLSDLSRYFFLRLNKFFGIKGSNKVRYQMALDIVLANLIYFEGANLKVYFRTQNRNKISYKIFDRVILGLVQIGALQLFKGQYQEKRSPVIVPHFKLIQRMAKIKLNFKFEYKANTIEQIKVKEDGVTITSYFKSPESPYFSQFNELNDQMTYINQFNSQAKFSINSKALDPSLKRIFHSDLNNSGRIYWPELNMNSGQRAKIKINGQNTVELDYTAIHLNIIYSIKGEQLEGDPYSKGQLTRYDRLNVKQAILILMNSPFDENSNLKTLRKKTKLCEVEANNLINDIKTEHPYLNQPSNWMRNHYVESTVMLNVLIRLVQEGIHALPIHDSVCFPVGRKKIVEKIMIEEYQKICKTEINVK